MNKNHYKRVIPRDFSMSRALTEHVLTTYLENGLSIKNPLLCLDLSTDQEESSKWANKHGSSVIIINAVPNKNELDVDKNPIRPTSTNSESNYCVIEKSDFNFIYVECITEGSSYFDCVFRKIARNGLFVISTSDDPALYGRPAEPALRCYSGLLVRTFYAQEMAVRLILASMARSAARFAKSIEVLFATVIKNSVTIIVQVRKGADSAIKCLRSVKSLVHCTVCEERAFLPENHGFVIDNVKKYLSCDCAKQNECQTVMSLGPLWAGSIGSPSFLASLLPHVKHSLHIETFLQDLITELRCCSQCPKKGSQLTKTSSCIQETNMEFSEIPVSSGDGMLKRKSEDDNAAASKSKVKKYENVDVEPAPPFYYSLHKHKPINTQTLVKVDKMIEMLHSQGFRASRTHFNRKAVKTNCTLKELQSLML